PRVVKAAAVPSAAPKAKPKPKPPPPPKPAKGAAPAKPKPAAKPEPKPEAKPKPAPPAALAAKTSAQKTEAETLACIRRVESGGNYGAVSPSGIYRGAYQMDDDFWRKYGGDAALTGRHEQASAAQQDAVAGRGFRDRGLDPWPSAVTECA
ncbi:MAG: transglycosylase family protein, partial [Actinomycetota bacterium]|nr:transglycosylase family protein [Actinomycetota bacterium]